jgi:hypothetical protein
MTGTAIKLESVSMDQMVKRQKIEMILTMGIPNNTLMFRTNRSGGLKVGEGQFQYLTHRNLKKCDTNDIAGWALVGTILYWVISEGSRILFPPRNLIPLL